MTEYIIFLHWEPRESRHLWIPQSGSPTAYCNIQQHTEAKGEASAMQKHRYTVCSLKWLWHDQKDLDSPDPVNRFVVASSGNTMLHSHTLKKPILTWLHISKQLTDHDVLLGYASNLGIFSFRLANGHFNVNFLTCVSATHT